MSYLEKVVKEEFRDLVVRDERLKYVALFVYVTGRYKKELNKYLESLRKKGL